MLKRCKRYLSAGAMAVMLLGAAGCSTSQQTTSVHTVEVDLISEVREASNQLISKSTGLNNRDPLLAATFADIDDLQQSSTFGRTLSEQFTSALASKGLPVIEVKMRESLFIKERTGELILSRKLNSLVEAHDAQAVLLGTYAMGGNYVYVNVRLVRTSDNIILGSHDFSLPLNRDIKAMLPRRR
ncbi:FlgO family outer membrane protein [Marinobacterium sp. MBR-109]|jgi:TolB-like protein|uniref:FlgO family outer membrane protein n=1 Tax=Marinobacterium sp. MBR-109 TaxID=3156462 RepID=UPI0033999D07